MSYDRTLSMEMIQVPQPAEMYCVDMIHRENIVLIQVLLWQHGDKFTCQDLVLVASIEILLWLTVTFHLHLGCWGCNFESGQDVQGCCCGVRPSMNMSPVCSMLGRLGKVEMLCIQVHG